MSDTAPREAPTRRRSLRIPLDDAMSQELAALAKDSVLDRKQIAQAAFKLGLEQIKKNKQVLAQLL